MNTDYNNQTKECPYCAEIINIKAKKCKHCNEILDAQMRDIDLLKKSSSPIIVNNNNNNNDNKKKNFPHLFHFIVTLFTGFWLIVWIMHYLLRDKNYYS